jgi:hypothetical protein
LAAVVRSTNLTDLRGTIYSTRRGGFIDRPQSAGGREHSAHLRPKIYPTTSLESHVRRGERLNFSVAFLEPDERTPAATVASCLRRIRARSLIRRVSTDDLCNPRKRGYGSRIKAFLQHASVSTQDDCKSSVMRDRIARMELTRGLRSPSSRNCAVSPSSQP